MERVDGALEQASTRSTGYGEILYRCAVVASRNGDKVKARKLLQLVHDPGALYPSRDSADKLLEDLLV